MTLDSLELTENWQRACRAEPLLERFDPPADSNDLVAGVLERCRGNADPPDSILQGRAAGFASADWETHGEVAFIQLSHLVREAARDPRATIDGVVDALAIVGQASIAHLLQAWRSHAEQDSLTQLGNRRKMESYSSSLVEAEQAIQYASIDLDGLKLINDRDGHEAGDAVIRTLGADLRLGLGRDGRAYRYGGDEFGVILLVSEDTKLGDLLTAIQARVEPTRFSWGVAEWPAEDSDFHSVVSLADRRMYDMKAQHKLESGGG